MERAEIVPVLEALAEGRDPAGAAGAPDDAVLQRPEVIRALFAAARELERPAPSERSARRASLPPSVGKAWTAEEEAAMASAFDGGRSLEELAAAQGRTRGAVRSRLVRLGKIRP